MATKFAFPIDCDNYYEFKLEKPDDSPDTGLLDVTGSLSQSDGGAPITGMPKYAAAETATLGTYALTTVAADSLANMATLVGWDGFMVIYEGSKVLGSDPCVFTAAARVSPS